MNIWYILYIKLIFVSLYEQLETIVWFYYYVKLSLCINFYILKALIKLVIIFLAFKNILNLINLSLFLKYKNWYYNYKTSKIRKVPIRKALKKKKKNTYYLMFLIPIKQRFLLKGSSFLPTSQWPLPHFLINK